jgi:XTP/dITP diphosphohydrolase
MNLLIATRNQGKKAEYAEILGDLSLGLVTLDDLGIDTEVDETGSTYVENALLKARSYAQQAQTLTLADDSGLEVDALGGEPGVQSARYGGPGASDEDRYRLLLQRLAGVPEEERTARFRCVIALVWPDGREELVEGTCEGLITREPRGSHGFGYDPVFFVPELGRTMAELPSEIKNCISHRARAAQKAHAILEQMLHS